MERGFDCDEWKNYCSRVILGQPIMNENNNQISAEMLRDTSSEERQHMFVIAQDFISKLWMIVNPELGGDYVHIFFAHIYALMKKHGGLGQYANQSVERNHSNENKVMTSKINHGARPRGATGNAQILTVANRQTKQMLEVLLCIHVLRMIILLQQIALAKPFSKIQKNLVKSYFSLCGWKMDSFPIDPDSPEYYNLIQFAQKFLEKWFFISKIEDKSCWKKNASRNAVFSRFYRRKGSGY
jgi:hypothetical protein